MTLAYIFIITSSVLFSLQFLFQKKYNMSEGESLFAAVKFTFLTAIVKILLVFALYGFSHRFTVFGMCVAAVYSLSGLLTVYFSAKAFLYADMSLYSVFMMLGGMLLPFCAGTMFFDESFNITKVLCLILVSISLALELSDNVKFSKKGVVFYFGIFITNGLAGVLSKLNQSPKYGIGMSSDSFLLATGIWSALICGVILVCMMFKARQRFLEKPKQALIFSGIYGLFSALGNLLVLLALEKLDASVQYPLITGGTIVFSTVIALFLHEKQNPRKYIAVVLAVLSAVVVAL